MFCFIFLLHYIKKSSLVSCSSKYGIISSWCQGKWDLSNETETTKHSKWKDRPTSPTLPLRTFGHWETPFRELSWVLYDDLQWWVGKMGGRLKRKRIYIYIYIYICTYIYVYIYIYPLPLEPPSHLSNPPL